MKRISPSEKMRKDLHETINSGVSTEKFIMSEIIRKGTQLMLQELAEQEVTDFLGRDRYERVKEDDAPKGYRNGYEPRTINTGEGKITIYQPQLRNTDEPFQSRLSAFLRGNTEVLEKLAI